MSDSVVQAAAVGGVLQPPPLPSSVFAVLQYFEEINHSIGGL